MTKQELIERVRVHGAHRNERMVDRVTKKEAEAWITAVCESIAYELIDGGEASLPGIGKLSVKDKPARTGRNPATGEEIDIPAKRVPHFSAAKALKDAVAN